ncbi:MAG: glutamine--fructose-6-phosphate transaminase (isomerizing), partial [Candidatus Komeilibacteria bacterium CG10_big_fil_rev_8_21_14_0_10_41_13]
MCGIFGQIGEGRTIQQLVECLQLLEFRGPDSVGIGFIQSKEIKVLKAVGRTSDLLAENDISNLPGKIAIGHVRWATHGQPNQLNAHPHLDCSGKIAIVHNGLIENHTELKKQLESIGHHFVSQTDSEVISHLIEGNYCGNLRQAVESALKLIEGTYGLVVMHSDHPDLLIAAALGAPLIIGRQQNCSLVASSEIALAGLVTEAVHLQDGDVFEITSSAYQRYRSGFREMSRSDRILASKDRVGKGGYNHYMIKEIHDQPTVFMNVCGGRLNHGAEDPIRLDGLEESAAALIDASNHLFLGCGTSWHAALLANYLFPRIAEVPVQVEYASEFNYRDLIMLPKTVIWAISQSGETADTLLSVKRAKKFGCRTIGLVNVVGSQIARAVDSGVYLHAGPEIGIASTKAFTSQVAALIMSALWLAQRRGLSSETINEYIVELLTIPNKMQIMLSDDNKRKIERLAGKFKEAGNFLFLGRGINFPVALEGALKLKEVSYIHAEGYPAAEMKHGPIALIDENM